MVSHLKRQETENINDRCRLRRWSSASRKYTSPSQIPAAKPGGIALYVNENKTVFMCFKQEVSIFMLIDKHLKSIYLFTYLGSNISSTESGVNLRTAKAWSAMNWLSIVGKFDFSDKIRWDLF